MKTPANTPFEVESEADMRSLGDALAQQFDAWAKPALVTLNGELGAGKSVLARAMIRFLGFDGAVKSPTYTLVESYTAGGWRIAHMDLYRVIDPEELHFIGFRDIVAGNDLLLVEWPEHALSQLPAPTLDVNIEYAGENRLVTLAYSA